MKHVLDEIAELLRREFVAFEICYQFAFAIEYRGMEGMDVETFVRVIVHVEIVADLLHLIEGAGENMPAFRVSVPFWRIAREGLRLVVAGVDDDIEQHEIAADDLTQ